ncbi:MFS transporter [Timonella sp. A28]|uniref:MFS transporter n=1 Tax=Timonella sp. A28 TaxID=3442640 RepID=UPI003EC0B80D
MSPTFASLKYYNYRIWFAAALVANIGTWMQRIAQDWLVLTQLTENSGTAVGIVTGLQFLPVLFFSAWAGVLADRLNRRTLLMVTQGLMGLLALGLGILTLTNLVQLWHVYLFAFLLGTVAAFDNPARQMFVSELVPADRLPNAVGLNSASFNAARLIGPGLSGLLIAVVGTGWSFIFNGLSFAVTIWAMSRMRVRELNKMPKVPRAKGQIREGIRYVRHRSDIIVIMIVVSVISTFGLNFQLTSAVMATEEFGKGSGEYGILGSILAIGSLSGALMAARRRKPRVRLVIGSAFAFGIASGLMALMPTYLTYALMSIPVGFASLTMMTAANAAIQTSVEPEIRGRVMALYLIVFVGATPVGAPVVGWIAEQFGPRWGIGIGSITAIAVAAWAALWTRKQWNYHVSYDLWHRPRITISYDRDTQGELTAVARVEDGPQLTKTQRLEVADRLTVQNASHSK